MLGTWRGVSFDIGAPGSLICVSCAKGKNRRIKSIRHRPSFTPFAVLSDIAELALDSITRRVFMRELSSLNSFIIESQVKKQRNRPVVTGCKLNAEPPRIKTVCRRHRARPKRPSCNSTTNKCFLLKPLVIQTRL